MVEWPPVLYVKILLRVIEGHVSDKRLSDQYHAEDLAMAEA